MVNRLALALLLLLLAGSAQAQKPVFGPVERPHSAIVGTGVVWSATLVQHPKNIACTTAACSVTATSTTAGNLLVLWSNAQYSGTGFATVMQFSAASDNGTAETWQHCPNSVINDAFSSDSGIYASDCWYILSAAGGATSVTATWTLSGKSVPTIQVDAELLEYHPTSTTFFDTGNAEFIGTSCTSCVGPAGKLSGTSDVVSQAFISDTAGSISSIGAPYSNPFDTDTAGNNLDAAVAGALSQSSYSVPTWTLSVSNVGLYASSVAFGGLSTPDPVGSMFIDMSGCTIGSAPTTTCIGNSIFTGWDNGNSSNAGAGMTVCTPPGSPPILLKTTTVNGVSRTGNTTKWLCGVTSSSGTNIGKWNVNFGLAQYNPMTVGYWFYSDCPAAGDCGANLRIQSNSDSATAHASPLGNGKWCFETSNEVTACTDLGIAYAPNTYYRINIKMLGTSGGNDAITICDTSGAVLATGTARSALTNNGTTTVGIGLNGEEPTTAGFHYYFGNIVVNGSFSTTSCF